jgi:hypothetical protein
VSEKTKDLLARLLWTLLQVTGAEIVVLMASWPQWLAIPIAGALSAVKTALANRYGPAARAVEDGD